MEAFALRCLLVACFILPPVAAAWRQNRAGGSAGWWIAALLALALGLTADPLAVALRRVDGALGAAICRT